MYVVYQMSLYEEHPSVEARNDVSQVALRVETIEGALSDTMFLTPLR